MFCLALVSNERLERPGYDESSSAGAAYDSPARQCRVSCTMRNPRPSGATVHKVEIKLTAKCRKARVGIPESTELLAHEQFYAIGQGLPVNWPPFSSAIKGSIHLWSLAKDLNLGRRLVFHGSICNVAKARASQLRRGYRNNQVPRKFLSVP